ncbi:XRE family transcriptional regulator [Pseudomonas nitroreducens]|uniref:XRE family transcriptional regulator n=1 Tax=Pseudomonas nitroreducens TaxID=46680 RepID=UPI00265A9DB3|nr:helix-turn-helix transcriptional regulator [Pseudomonas nitroreducens]MCP1652708.1 transcriptional regulator with XRE-family HTH domain [Pseudomonas nitroreducens]
MTETKTLIAQRLRKCRAQAGWTYEETGNRLGIPPSRYSNWELEIRSPKLDQLKECAKVFGVNAAWLAGLDDNEERLITPPTSYYSQKTGTTIQTTPAGSSCAYRTTWLIGQGLDPEQLLVAWAPDTTMRGVINQSDEVLIDRRVTSVKALDLYALAVNGAIWFRKIRPNLDGSYTITAEDAAAFPDDTMTAEQLAEQEIIGRVCRINHARPR